MEITGKDMQSRHIKMTTAYGCVQKGPWGGGERCAQGTISKADWQC